MVASLHGGVGGVVRGYGPLPASAQMRFPGIWKSHGRDDHAGESSWLNLSSLSQKEKVQLLDVPVDPKGLFGPALASMQKRFEEKKREGEALQLCLPRKAPATSPAAHRQIFTQAVARPGSQFPKC